MTISNFCVKNNVHWVGKQDWELREFHGGELSISRGTSYNSYLIREEKTVLIDTVHAPFSEEFVENLQNLVDLSKIDLVISNHAEVDHSGALPALMAKIPDCPLYCTEWGMKNLRGLYRQEWNFHVVRTGDEVDIGNGKKLIFIEALMLHWPDSMFTYMTGDNILFSNDAFGQHYATNRMFDDLCDEAELWQESLKYFACILTPFARLVTRKINEVVAMNLPIDMVATSHGIIWRKNPMKIIEAYLKWSDTYKEEQITIVYDTVYSSTRKMAEAFQRGIEKADPNMTVKLFNLNTGDHSDIITEIFKSKAVMFGSPTIDNVMMAAMSGILEEVEGLKFYQKSACAFGSYGWHGGAIDRIETRLRSSGWRVYPGFSQNWKPSDQDVTACEKFAEEFVANVARPWDLPPPAPFKPKKAESTQKYDQGSTAPSSPTTAQ